MTYDINQYPSEFDSGHNRFLSLHERISPPNMLCCTMSDGTEISAECEAVGVVEQPIIPMKDWEPFSLRDKIWWDLDLEDQNGFNFCWTFSATQAHMLARECAGLPRIVLSAAELGGTITGGSNRGGGLDEGLAGLMLLGQVPTSMVANDSINPRSYPKGVTAIAKTRRVVQAYDCLSSQVFEKLASGILRGRPGAFGMYWGRGAHALCAMGLVRLDNGNWALDVLGSWGSTAHSGDGTLRLTAAQLRGVNTFGGYVIGVPSMEAEEALPPIPK